MNNSNNVKVEIGQIWYGPINNYWGIVCNVQPNWALLKVNDGRGDMTMSVSVVDKTIFFKNSWIHVTFEKICEKCCNYNCKQQCKINLIHGKVFIE